MEIEKMNDRDMRSAIYNRLTNKQNDTKANVFGNRSVYLCSSNYLILLLMKGLVSFCGTVAELREFLKKLIVMENEIQQTDIIERLGTD
jgi:hypothetical protein